MLEFSIHLGIGFTVETHMQHSREHLLHCPQRLHPRCLVLPTHYPQVHSLLRPLVHQESPLVDGLRLTNLELEFSNWFTEAGLCVGFVGEATDGVFANDHGSNAKGSS